MLRGHRAGGLADAAELLRPLPHAGGGHVAGAAGGGRSQPRWVSLAVSMMSRLDAHVLLCLRSSRAQPHLVLCCVPCSGPGAELPGQVPLLPLPGGRAGGRPAAQRGGEEAEPGGAAGHPAAPLADRAGRPHEDDLEETVRICKSPQN